MRSRGQDIRSTADLLAEACSTCGNLALSALGPLGRPKIINATQGSGAGLLSSISGRLFQGIHFTDPVAQLLVQSTVLTQHQRYGDGGLLCMHVATRLISHALQYCKSRPLARLQVVKAYQQALDWTAEFLGQKPVEVQHDSNVALPPICLNLSTAGASAYVALARTVLTPKKVAGLSQAALETLCVAVVQAFLAALPNATGDGRDAQSALQPPCVRVMPVVGLDCEHLSCVEGVLLDLPIAPFLARRLPCRDAVVALFDVSLDVSPPPTESDHSHKVDSSLQMEAHGEGWGRSTAELEQLLLLADALSSAGVQVVACQKVINPRLQHALQRNGIICLQRLSVLHVTAFAHTTGAIPMSGTRWAKHSPMSLGTAGCISMQEFGPKSLLSVTPGKSSQNALQQGKHDLSSRQQPVHTLVMGCLHDTAADELAAAVACALKVLAWAIQVPYAVPGGGCAEVLIAQHVRNCAKSAPRMSALQVAAIEAYASALDAVAVKLVPWGDFASILEAWHSVVQSHRMEQVVSSQFVPFQTMHQTEFIGFRHSTSQFSGVVTGCMPGQDFENKQDIAGAYLLDLLVCKLSSLASAVDSSATMLRIDQCVVTSA